MIAEYILHLLIFAGIFAILGMGLNIAMGYTGLMNLGYAGIYGIGAYTTALLSINAGVPVLISMLIGGLLAAVVSYALCFPSLRLKGDYLALATIGFGFIIESIFVNWTSLTNGSLGISKIPKANLFGLEFSSLILYFVLVLVAVIIIYFALKKLVNAPFGRVLKSIRDDELASSMLGKDTFKFKSWALIISGFVGGLAGGLYASYITFIDPSSFTIIESILVVMVVIIGGMGSLKGSIIGALIVVFLPEPLRFLNLPPSAVGALRQMIYALIIIVLIMKRPQGILGEFNAKGDRRKK